MRMLKIWHGLGYKGHFCLCVQWKTNAFSCAFTQEVLQSCNMLRHGIEQCGCISPVCRYVLSIISVKILHKCDETSFTVTHIAVSHLSERQP